MTREDEPGLGLELPVNRAPAHDLTGISAAAPKETLGAVVAGAACAGSLVFFLLEIPRYRTLFWLIWPSRSSIGKACLVRAHFLPVVVERFRRGAKRRGAQAATQGPGLECQAGFDLFADHSLRFCSGGLAANCQLHGAKPNNRGSFKSQ